MTNKNVMDVNPAVSSRRNKMQHDKLVKTLEERLNKFCEMVVVKTPYSFADPERMFKDYEDGRCYGEADLIGVHYNTAFAIEIKGRDYMSNRQKAMYQLKKDKEYLSSICEDYKIHTFYAYSADNKRGYTVEEIHDDRRHN